MPLNTTAVNAHIQEIVKGFLWKDGTWNYHTPHSMTTPHLFNTLRMIWNHRMPNDAKMRPYRVCTFGPEYTKDYLSHAIMCLGYELSQRTDLNRRMKSDLRWMMQYVGVKEWSQLLEGTPNVNNS